MPTAKLSGFAQQIGRFVPETHVATDGDLLAEFVATRDERAFAELVGRYGPLVFAVCRRVTGSHHLAEDAFQAVFVVLAAKAGCVRPASALAAWLHGVATRTALRARTVADRRRRREAPVEVLPDLARHEVAPAETTDLATVVDEEIARLPDALRVTVVLCELEGCSRKDASERLGVPEGTVSSRLAAARKTLATRLRGRGIALSAGGLSLALGSQSRAGLPAGLNARALACAMSPGVVPAAVAALSTGVLRIMFAQKLKAVLPLTVIALAALTCAAFAAGYDPPTVPQPAAKPTTGVATRHADPVLPKAAPKQLPKGPNKLLFWRDGKLVVADPDGKNTREFELKGHRYKEGCVRLSPDGKMIAALVPGPEPAADGTPGAKRQPMALHVRPLSGDGPGTDLDADCNVFMWSADGTEIACSRPESDVLPPHHRFVTKFTSFVVNVKSKEKTSLRLPANHVVTDWARDGHLLTTSLTVTDWTNMKGGLHLMNRDGTEHKALTGTSDIAALGRISPDGRAVLCVWVTLSEETPAEQKARQEAGRPAPERAMLAVLDVATGKITKVADVPRNGGVGDCCYCWSPDGKRIAYTWHENSVDKFGNSNEELESRLIVCDPDGKNAQTVASQKGNSKLPRTLGSVDWR